MVLGAGRQLERCRARGGAVLADGLEAAARRRLQAAGEAHDAGGGRRRDAAALLVRCERLLRSFILCRHKRLTRSVFVRSHTCSFQLDLPEYPTAAELQHKLRRALEEQAFGLA